MATHIPQRDLRNHPGEVLARVERGEELTVTVRGRPVADLIPTRERERKAGASWDRFAAGLQGLLAADDRFEADVREGLAGEAADPFEQWLQAPRCSTPRS
jgi:prevent-host-death family protein